MTPVFRIVADGKNITALINDRLSVSYTHLRAHET